MSLLLFIGILIVSFVIVRIGAIAFQLTGLEWSLAKFQSLSCFTGTGFTTREAELVTGNPQRRRIASVLMVLGNAGLVTLIATLANSLRADLLFAEFSVPYLDSVIPSYLKIWVKLILIAAAVYGIYRLFIRSRLAAKLTEFLRDNLVKSEMIRHISFEELMVTTGGYGVSSVEAQEGMPFLNKTLSDARLRQHDITVLVVERGGRTIPNPPAPTVITPGDRLICFGRLDSMRTQFRVAPEET